MRNASIVLMIAIFMGCGPVSGLERGRDNPAAGTAAGSREADALLSITAIDVGQGDAILIRTPSGEAMLVDAGPAGAGRLSVLPLIIERGIDELTAIVITHYHADHMAGLSEIASGADGAPGTPDDIRIGAIYERKEPGDEGSDPLADYGPLPDCPRQAVHAGDRIELGDVALEVVAANALFADGTEIDPGDPADENAMGVALMLSYEGFKMLLEADITGGGGEPPYDTPDVETPLAALAGDIDVLKVAHHGSKTATNQAFLDAVTPEIAIISVGDGNDYGHPHASVIERLIESGAVVYQTERGWLDIEGPIVAGSDVTIEVDGDGGYRVILE
ncbi:MAG: MBL fold metallo-hydrolase [bacterium]